MLNNSNFEQNQSNLVHLMLTRPCLSPLRARSLYVALVRTAENGRLGFALLLLTAGADPNFPLYDLDPPLNISAELGNLRMVKTLIEHEASLRRYNTTGLTPLMNAAKGGHLEICKILIDSGKLLTLT